MRSDWVDAAQLAKTSEIAHPSLSSKALADQISDWSMALALFDISEGGNSSRARLQILTIKGSAAALNTHGESSSKPEHIIALGCLCHNQNPDGSVFTLTSHGNAQVARTIDSCLKRNTYRFAAIPKKGSQDTRDWRVLPPAESSQELPPGTKQPQPADQPKGKFQYDLPDYWFVKPTTPGVRNLFQASIALSTAKTYSPLLLKFLNFCHAEELQPLSISKAKLLDFIAARAKDSASTAYLMLAAIKKFFTLNGAPGTSLESDDIACLLKGAHNLASYKPPRIHRLAMTKPAMVVCYHLISSLPWVKEDIIVTWCLFLLGYWGSVHVGDVVSAYSNKVSPKTLLWSHVSIHTNKVTLALAEPKVTANRKDYVVTLHHHADPIFDPVAFFGHSKNANPLKPVFQYRSGKLVTIRLVNKLLTRSMRFQRESDSAGESRCSRPLRYDRKSKTNDDPIEEDPIW